MDPEAALSEPISPVATAGAQPTAPPSETVRDWSTSRLKSTLRVMNLCNGIALVALGILVFLLSMTTVSFTTVTVSAYVVFFGLLLSCLECNISAMAPRFHRNFGFMFSFAGRALFIIFSGTMAFAMANWLGYIVGAATCLNGLFNGYVICVHPSFKTGELSARGDPYGGYTGGETEMLNYLKSNPDLATRAGTAAATFASNNPDAAMKIAGAAYGK